jgi:hypothetical protein
MSMSLKNGSRRWMSWSRSYRSERPWTTSSLNVSSQALRHMNPASRDVRLLSRPSRGTSRALVSWSWLTSWLLTPGSAP